MQSSSFFSLKLGTLYICALCFALGVAMGPAVGPSLATAAVGYTTMTAAVGETINAQIPLPLAAAAVAAGEKYMDVLNVAGELQANAYTALGSGISSLSSSLPSRPFVPLTPEEPLSGQALDSFVHTQSVAAEVLSTLPPTPLPPVGSVTLSMPTPIPGPTFSVGNLSTWWSALNTQAVERMTAEGSP